MSKYYLVFVFVVFLLLVACSVAPPVTLTIVPDTTTPAVALTSVLTPITTVTPTPTLMVTPTLTPTSTVTKEPTRSPEERVIKKMEILGMTDRSLYTVIEKGGKIKLLQAGTATVIYNNGYFSYDFAFYIAKNNCESTDFGFKPGTNLPINADGTVAGPGNSVDDGFSKYIASVMGSISMNYGVTVSVPIWGSKNCWISANDHYLYFRDNNGSNHKLSVFDAEKVKGDQGIFLWPIKR